MKGVRTLNFGINFEGRTVEVEVVFDDDLKELEKFSKTDEDFENKVLELLAGHLRDGFSTYVRLELEKEGFYGDTGST